MKYARETVWPGSSNTFSVTLFDDGTGIDENANQPLNPANPIGNNAVPFDLQEGPTDLRFTTVSLRTTGSQCWWDARRGRKEAGSSCSITAEWICWERTSHPVIAGYSIGGLNPLNPPGLCEINLSKAAAAADTNPFGVLADTNGQTANICANCCIGEGTEPTIFELFNEGLTAATGAGGEVTFARPDFDLRFEGNDAALCTRVEAARSESRESMLLRSRDARRRRIRQCLTVVAGTFVTTPTTTGVVNALCAVQLNLVGCGFFPNEVTIICQGFQAETGIPLQRPGKTVTTAATLACDTNGDGIAGSDGGVDERDAGELQPGESDDPDDGDVWAKLEHGVPGERAAEELATITVTTTFSAGDNNVFGPFTRTTTCSLALGTRAPVVISVTPSSGTVRSAARRADHGSVFHVHAGGAGGTAIIGTVTSVFARDR